MESRWRNLFIGLVLAVAYLAALPASSSAMTVIDTLPGNCNYSNVSAQAYGGTFVASDSVLKSFTIRAGWSSGTPQKIVIAATDGTTPALDGGELWSQTVVATTSNHVLQTYEPNIELVPGDLYFIGLDFRSPDNSPATAALYCQSGNPIQGDFWLYSGNAWSIQSPGDNDLAASITMTSPARHDLRLFQETFFSTEPGGPYLLNLSDPTSPTSGPAELGVMILQRADASNLVGVFEDLTGFPGKSLVLANGAAASAGPLLLTGKVAPLPVPELLNTGVYEISWLSSCGAGHIVSATCINGGIELRDENDVPRLTISYPELTMDPTTPHRFVLRVDMDNQFYSLSIDGIETSAIDLGRFSLSSFNFFIQSTGTGESYALKDVRIVKLVEDIDGDRIADNLDNCLSIPNPSQSNWDSDRLGDVCDPCPLATNDPTTGVCPTDIIEPTANVDFFNRRNGNIRICVSWPGVPDAPEYVFLPNCDNVHFVLEDAEGNILSPACLTSKPYDISEAVEYISNDLYCIQSGCDLRDRFPQLQTINPLEGITIRRIVYENFVTDPGIDPITGDCIDLVSGEVLNDPGACRDIWVGQIEIEPPDIFDDDPVAENDSFAIDEDATLDANVTSNDIDDDPLTATLVSSPTKGTLTWNDDGHFIYQPTADYNGSDSFSYYVNDGLADSNVADVTITINPVVDISDDSDSTIKGVPVTTDVLYNDTFEGSPTISGIKNGKNGTVSKNDNTLTYTPSADFVGTDGYTYTVSSGGVDETAIVSIWVHYDWDGFYSPIDNDLINKVKAGRAIPMKFSLGGDQGLDVFAPGYPNSIPVVCDANAIWVNEIDGEIETPGNSGLTYDFTNDQYTYIWKTKKSWEGCRQLQLKLDDGSTHMVVFEFK